MPTVNQLVNINRKPRVYKNKRPDLRKCPQKKGVCVKVFEMTPRKPNSARRKVARIAIMRNKKKPIAYIPGIGHNLQKYSNVLIRGGRVKDLPGMKYTIIRGVLDLRRLELRRNKRSKYGTKKLVLLKRDYKDGFKKFYYH